jgi:hypothetical protein
MIIGSIVLVLASMYGGDSLGSWFTFEIGGVVYEDGVVETENWTTERVYSPFKTSVNFMLTEYEVELEMDGESNDEKSDYDDSDAIFCDSDCDELNDLMIGKIQNLLYVVILAGFAALYFLNQDDEEKGAMACLAMGGAGLLAVGMFTLSFPEALDDDQNSFSEIGEDPSLFGDESVDEAGQFEGDATWRPGLAFALVGLSGILGMAAYQKLNSESP